MIVKKMKFTEKEQLEHIRLRPGMYLGRLGDGDHLKDGIYRMLQEVVNNSIEEHLQGYGENIEVSIEDGRTVSVRDYGRGQLLEERDRSGIPCTKTIRGFYLTKRIYI